MHDFEIFGKCVKLGWGQDTAKLTDNVMGEALSQIQRIVNGKQPVINSDSRKRKAK
jgi:hypothetical protein